MTECFKCTNINHNHIGRVSYSGVEINQYRMCYIITSRLHTNGTKIFFFYMNLLYFFLYIFMPHRTVFSSLLNVTVFINLITYTISKPS